MKKASRNLKILLYVLVALTATGLVVDYNVDKINFPNVYTLFPLCLLIITLLVMLVIWVFKIMTQQDR